MNGKLARTLRLAVVLLFFASGFSGLVYQVAWVRLLTPVFGISAYAISTVLASFMGGLALGSFAFGRFIDRRPDPLRVYGLLEIGIGLYALLVPALFGFTLVVTRFAYGLVGEASPLLFGLLRAAIAFAILVLPTTLMGATLPVLCKFFIETLDRVGRETGKLYFVNTLGAVVGCATAGFLLIPQLGLVVAIAIAACINLLVGLVALLVHRTVRSAAALPGPALELESAPSALSRSTRWVVFAFGLSGFTALLLEVIWTRVLVLVFGSTVYSFAAMLSVFLLGIALGGALFGKLADRSKSPYRLLGVMLATIALIVLAEAAVINYLPETFLRLLAVAGVKDSSLALIKFVISFAILFPLTLVSGGTFPVVAKIFTDNLGQTGREIGLVYSVNTLGAIAGALLGGFAILPLLGMRLGLVLSAWLALLSGVVTLVISRPAATRRPLLAGTFAVAALVGTFFLPRWNAALLSVPVWFQPTLYIGAGGEVNLNEVIGETKNLFYGEGLSDTIIVNESPTERILSINGKIIASTAWEDMVSLKMLGHLPVLVHPGRPRTALNIGLGIGGTVSALASHDDVEHVDGVELEKKVVEANPLFASVNDHILANPKFHMVVADGRNYLSLADRKYDIIVSDPYDPFMTGAGVLNSREHFQLGRRHLNPRGVLVQWVPLYQMRDREYRSLLKTFATVFPHMTVWFAGRSVMLVGTEEKLALDPAVLRARMEQPAARSTLQRLGLDTPERLLPYLLADERSLATYLADAPLNTDAFPYVEYSSAWAILKLTTGPNLKAMSRYFLSPEEVLAYVIPRAEEKGFDPPSARALLAANRLGIEGMVESYEGLPEAFQKVTAAVAASRDPYLAAWLADMHERAGLAAERAGNGPIAAAHFEGALRAVPDQFGSLLNLGNLMLVSGDLPRARALLEQAHRVYPSSAQVEMRLATVYDALGESARARQLYESAIARRPDIPLPVFLLAEHHLNHGDAATAEKLFRDGLAKSPEDVEAREGLARALYEQGRIEDADHACAALVKDQPGRTPCRVIQGVIRVRRGDLPAARTAFLSAIQANGADSEPYFQLARVDMAQGRKENAAQSLRRAIELGGEAYAQRASMDETLAPLIAPRPQ